MLRRSSPCKVNLLLNILGRRADGFHELETLFHHVPLTDELSFEIAAPGVILSCNDPRPGGRLEFGTSGRHPVSRQRPAWKIAVSRSTWKSASLGGGSGCRLGECRPYVARVDRALGQPLSAEQLDRLAAGLGSDVNFFLQDRPALARGRGEQVISLEPFTALRGAGLFLFTPVLASPTPWAFGELRSPSSTLDRPTRSRHRSGRNLGVEI